MFPTTTVADQVGIVVNTPAYIYEKADFDSKVVSELPQGRRITISSRKTGPFYRTRSGKNKIGYVSDGDVKPANGKADPPSIKNGKAVPGHSPAEVRRRDPWWSASKLGAGLAYVQYSEVVAKLQFQEAETDYAIKYSFPFHLFEGPYHMDINLLAHLEAPGFYSGISSTTPSGYYLELDTPILYTFAHLFSNAGAVYFGVGPMLNFSNYSVTLNGVPSQLEELRVGGLINLGFAFRLGSKLVLKVEPRYYLEQANYLSILGSLQLFL